MSIFAFRVNGGAWQYTYWYYGDVLGGQFYDPNRGRWVELGMGAMPGQLLARGLVEAWEYYYYFRPSISTGWNNLGSCRASVY